MTAIVVSADRRRPAAEYPWFTTGEPMSQTRPVNRLQQDQGIATVVDRLAWKFPALDRIRTVRGILQTVSHHECSDQAAGTRTTPQRRADHSPVLTFTFHALSVATGIL